MVDIAVEDVLVSEPQEILAQLSTLPPNFNWRGLGEGASAYLFFSQNRNNTFLWAEIAVTAFERAGAVESAMAISARLIRRFGPGHHGGINDPSRIENWVKQSLCWPLSEVETRARNWRSLPKKEILILRKIKNKLAIVGLVEEHIEDTEIRNLLVIGSQLP